MVKMHYYCDKSQDHIDVTMTFTSNHFSMADSEYFILQFMFTSRENLVLVSAHIDTITEQQCDITSLYL